MVQIVGGLRSMASRRTEPSCNSSAVPILVSSSLVNTVIGGPASSELDQDLDGFAFVHCPVASRHVVEAGDPIEDSTGLDPAFQYVREQFWEGRAGRGGSAAHRDVVIERRPRRGHGLVLGNTHAADRATWTGDAERGTFRLLEAHALKDRVDAVTVGKFAYALNCLVASLADDVGCAKPSRQRDPVRMTAQQDDLLRAKAPGGNHATQADGAVSDDRRRLPRANFGHDRRMMAGRHHICKG